MTKGGRIFAGIFSLIAGGINILLGVVLIFVGIVTFTEDPRLWLAVFLLIALGTLGLIGGIILITDHGAGGVLALVAGTGGIIMISIYWAFLINVLGMPLDLAATIMSLLFIPPAMMIVGGIVGIAVGSET